MSINDIIVVLFISKFLLMKSIFKKPRLKAQTSSRNAFDLSSGRVFSAPFGALLPCFVKRVNPDDFVELSVENQIICEPLVKPAFMRLKEHIDYYFVPYSQLWMPFENFVLGQDSYFSASVADAQNKSIPAAVPYFNGYYIKDVFGELSKQYDIHAYNKEYNALRLLDLLKYGNYYASMSNTDSQVGSMGNMNFFALLAYQKIYYDFYRNPLYEANDVEAYNIDDLMGGLYGPVAGASFTPTSRDYKFFEMHYRWNKKDYFMDVRPYILPSASEIGYTGLQTQISFSNPYFAVPGSNPVEQSNSNSNAKPTQEVKNYNTPNNDGSRGDFISPAMFGKTSALSANQGRLSVQGIRLAFAFDRLLRRQREAGAVFDKQMLAQFGIVPFDERHGKCYFIGGQTNRLFSGDITQTAQDSNNKGLGSLAGQINVYSPARRTFKYHAKEHGIIMGIYSTSMENVYPSFLQDRMNLSKLRFDWFNPVFDKQGLQPILLRELNMLDDQHFDVDNNTYDPQWFSQDCDTILGYVRRYADQKTAIDTAHGLFASKVLSADDSAWVAKYHPTTYANNVPPQLPPLTMITMTENPATFDDVAGVEYNGNWNTDHFKINHLTHCKVISNMDLIGEDF